MVKIIEIAATMIIVLLGSKIEEYYKSDLVELHLLNSNITYVKLNKGNNYSCPKTCSAIHFHDALISENKVINENYSLTYNKEDNISLNGVDVIDAFEIIEPKKSKKNKVQKNQRNKLDFKNFMNKYN